MVDRSTRYLLIGIGFSALLHLVVLGVKFTYANPRILESFAPLEILLVNSKSASKPLQADALAQANLDGGGNTDQNRRIKTPLPVQKDNQLAQEVEKALKKQEQLEQEAYRLMSQIKASQITPQIEHKQQNRERPIDTTDNGSLVQRSLEMAKLEGQISKNMDAYQKRPKRQFLGARTREYRFARYIEDWRIKVERVGTLNYPQAAKEQKIYGTLQLTVSINADGSVEEIEINRSSGHKVLDEAAKRIVSIAAPFAPFPEDIRRDTDILSITRTWTFTQNQLVGAD